MRPPGLTSAGRALEHGFLLLDALGQRARANAPFGVGIAPPGADAGAGRIDQHQIGAAGEIGQDIGVAAPPLGVRTWILRAPARAMRSWIAASRRLSVSVA